MFNFPGFDAYIIELRQFREDLPSFDLISDALIADARNGDIELGPGREWVNYDEVHEVFIACQNGWQSPPVLDYPEWEALGQWLRLFAREYQPIELRMDVISVRKARRVACCQVSHQDLALSEDYPDCGRSLR